MLKRAGIRYSENRRRHRAQLLRARQPLAAHHRVLDLGGGDGAHIGLIWPGHPGITVADLDPAALESARSRGFRTVQLDASGRLPFADKEFDFVFCSSVIEHVTGPKEEMVAMTDGRAFAQRAWQHQLRFAAEIRRIARGYWVQTPNRYFIMESHSWLPGFVAFLPRPMLVRLLALFARFWPKATLPDWNLLNADHMSRLFPRAEILRERSLGMTKSLIAFHALTPGVRESRPIPSP